MNVYRAAPGHVSPSLLVTIVPQPKTGIAPHTPELNYYGSGRAEFNGQLFSELQWTALTRLQVSALLAQFGLSQTVASGLVTVRILTRDGAFAHYHGRAVYLRAEKPEPTGWLDFRIRLNELEAI